MRIIVLGATGMLGYQVFRISLKRKLDVYGIVRNKSALISKFGKVIDECVYEIDDVRDKNILNQLFSRIRPDYVINCIGIVKQSHLSQNYIESIAINSLFPHELQRLCSEFDSHLIHISTDCVFNGLKGLYTEADQSNAYDLYGKSKHLGEVDYGKGLTIRTSIIGHELSQSSHGLLEWFLSQTEEVKGFEKAIFSGLTTLELTKVLLDFIIPQKVSVGLFHVAANPISKYALLRMIAEVYKRKINIVASQELIIDRSLDGSKFASLTGYQVPSWHELIEEMNFDFNNGF